MKNPNCDVGKCRTEGGEVRILPAGGDSNIILCRACLCQEINFRIDRNRNLEDSAKFPLPSWESLKVYLPATEPEEPVSQNGEKLYQCNQCGALKLIKTNHFGECYSWGNVNVCPVCPPFRRPTTWRCIEKVPDGGWIPEPWKKVEVQISTN